MEPVPYRIRAEDVDEVLTAYEASDDVRTEAREYVLRAGKQAFGRYTSWADLSAGYSLGRVLRFDNDEFDVWYNTVLEPHQVLLTDPASPWLTLPWPTRR